MKKLQKRIARLIGAVFLLLIIVSTGSSAADAEKLDVVATTSDLASIARWVGGEHVKVQEVCDGTHDPHFLQAKPGYIMMARDADLWIRVGMELEIGWEPVILDSARNPSIRESARGHLDSAENILRLDVPKRRITRAMGDVHAMGNPHHWLDPLNGRIIAGDISDRLSTLAPEKSEEFEKKLSAFREKLDKKMFGEELVAEVGGSRLWALELKGRLGDYLKENGLTGKLGGWAGRMRPVAGTKIVTHHELWTYFAHRFDLDVVETLEPKPGIPPSSSHLVDVMKTVKAQDVPLILVSSLYTRKAADLVASRTGATVVICASSVGGQQGVDDYFALFDNAVSRVAKAFEGGN